MSNQRPIYRQEALDSQNNADQFDQTVHLVTLKGWMLLGVIGSTMLMLLFWILWASVSH